MTVIAVKLDKRGEPTVAADSRCSIESESGGIRYFQCEKLFRKTVNGEDVIIATAGDGFPGLAFVEWYGSGKEPPELFVLGEADFSVLVVSKSRIVEYDKWCRPDVIIPTHGCYAIGCGAKAAMGAMLAGASATRAVEITNDIDPLCGPPVVTMRLREPKPKKTLKSLTAPVSPVTVNTTGTTSEVPKQ